MPGLSQLKQFNKDLLSIGDEVNLRAVRGEKPVTIPIPKEIEDIDDSEDFVLGMPENEAEVVEDNPVDEDLSDLINMGMGTSAGSSESKSEQPEASFEAPDMSSLLNPINIPDDASAGVEMPDLSMFMEPVEEEPEIVEEEEPEEISIADMGLEALLAGGGFDEPEESENSADDFEENETPVISDTFEDIDSVDNIEEIEDIEEIDEIEETEDEIQPLSEAEVLADIFGETASSDDYAIDTSKTGFDASVLDTPAESSDLEDIGDLDFDLEPTENFGNETSEASDFDLAGFASPSDNTTESDDFGIPVEDVTGEFNLPKEKTEDAGDSFDLEDIGDSGIEESESEKTSSDDIDLSDLGDIAFEDITENEDSKLEFIGELDENDIPSKNTADLDDIGDFDAIDVNVSGDTTGLDDLGDLGVGDTAGLDDIGELDAGDTAGLDDLGDFGTGDTAGLDDIGELDAGDTTGLDDIGDFDAIDVNASGDTTGLDDLGNFDTGDTAGLDDLGDFGTGDTAGLDDIGELDTGDTTGLDDLGDFGTGDTSGLDDIGELDAGDTTGLDDLGDFGTGDTAGLDDIGELDAGDTTGLDDLGDFGTGDTAGLDDIGELDAGDTAGLDDLGDFGTGDTAGLDDIGELDAGDTTGLDDLGDFGTGDTAGLDDIGELDTGDTAGLDDLGDFGTGDTAGLDDIGELDAGDTAGLDDLGDFGNFGAVDIDMSESIPDYSDSEVSFGDESEESAESIETFDTSEMEGMDFDIADTDSQLNKNDFELGSGDEFSMEGEFEIPGFSDVETVKEEKSHTKLSSGKDKAKTKARKGSESEEDEENLKLPPNTLSDAQYKKFLANLNEYPLNVRLAFEDFIVQDEFTDDAEFEIVEKILNKAPARQVASMLEKMLDISLPVPRDFEHRTAEEYEAYKKSLSYQLRNKIIPGALVGILLMLVGWGLFNFGKNCIYKPIKASSLYKQGYALLAQNEYPQSEMKFNEAVTYRLNKKWFFNYARGYREHKQYQRAGKMYKNILTCFRHDKAAGLEYADMELNDLANYEKAEEIVRREVLDYHINDADGILMLGDVFLEWGTEKDPAKLEDARAQYATLLQLYKANDLYLSRMMRYFIRSDNLRQVLQIKPAFEPKEKSLSGDDWTELSGYLLEKSYGPLPPAEEYLRYQIEGVRGMLLRAVKTNPESPIALYNLSKYFIESQEIAGIEPTLKRAIEKFNSVPSMKKRDIYKYIDSYRLLGEYYIGTTDYLQAQEQFAEGISLYTTERDNAGFAGTEQIGKMYEDLANIKYTVSGDYDEALLNYKNSVELGNDTPSIRYRIGYIQYKKKNYAEALGSFMKAGDGNVKERNLMLSMANTLSLRGDDYAAEGYYNQLINKLDTEIAESGLVFPQANVDDYKLINSYLYAANNYGVTLYRLAKRTGDSGLNAEAIVQFSQSVRAWDALTRNLDTMVRLGGSNLAEQNIAYITHRMPDFEPAIYTDIPKTLLDNERF